MTATYLLNEPTIFPLEDMKHVAEGPLLSDSNIASRFVLPYIVRAGE